MCVYCMHASVATLTRLIESTRFSTLSLSSFFVVVGKVLLYANSSDGLTWGKPKLGLFDVGSVRKDLAHIGKANNIIMKGGG